MFHKDYEIKSKSMRPVFCTFWPYSTDLNMALEAHQWHYYWSVVAWYRGKFRDMGLHSAKLDFLLHFIFCLGELAFLRTRSCTADYVAETMTWMTEYVKKYPGLIRLSALLRARSCMTQCVADNQGWYVSECIAKNRSCMAEYVSENQDLFCLVPCREQGLVWRWILTFNTNVSQS